MINSAAIIKIEKLLSEDTDASLTYAALECRLAIERICYERLRLVHDYISHDDLKRWQPRDIVNTLIQEVDTMAASTFTLSMSKDPLTESSSDIDLQKLQEKEYIPLGTQIGFNPNRLGKLWNGLANVVLHVSIPTSKDIDIPHYGDSYSIRAKVVESLEEIRRINEATLASSGLGEVVSFECVCGTKNSRRLELLKDGQIVNCINPKCDESYEFELSDTSFGQRTAEIICKKCKKLTEFPKRKAEKLRTDQRIYFNCEGCGQSISVQWALMQYQAAGQ